MGRVYKTANGRNLDMDRLRLQNETTIAVGNMRVNARGDQLGPGGEVEKNRNQLSQEQYQMNVSPTAHQQRVRAVQEAQRQAGASTQAQRPSAPVVPDVDPSGEPFDPPETAAAEEENPTMRGSLADSIARQVTIEQKTLPPKPNKPKGPQRF